MVCVPALNLFQIGAILTCIVLLIILKIYNGYTKRNSETIFRKAKGNDNKAAVYNTLQKIYPYLVKFPITKPYALGMQKTLESYFPGDKPALCSMVCVITLVVYSVSAVIFTVAMWLKPTIYSFLCSCIVIYFINAETLSYAIRKTEDTVLEELVSFMEQLQFNYLRSHSITDAMHDSIKGKNKVMAKHASLMLTVLDSSSFERDLNAYMGTVHNPFLKELMCICATVYLYGDKEEDGESCFLKNLRKLKDRVGDENLQRRDIAYAFSCTTALTLPPLFLSIVIIDWAVATFAELEAYFNGYYGFLVNIAVPTSCIVCYFIIRRLRLRGEADTSSHSLLTRISNLPVIRKVLLRYYNTNYGKSVQLTRLLKQTGSRLTIYTLAVKSALFAVAGVVLSLALIVGMNVSTRQRVENEIVGRGSKSSAATEEMSVMMMMLIRSYVDEYLSVNVLDEYNEATGDDAVLVTPLIKQWVYDSVLSRLMVSTIEISDEQALMAIKQYNKEHSNNTKLYTAYLGSTDGPIREDNQAMYDTGVSQLDELRNNAEMPEALSIVSLRESVASDVANAVYSYNNAYLHWWEVMIAFAVGTGAFFLPYCWILFNKQMTQQMMEAEVTQFQSLILILRSSSHVSEAEILDWMMKFAVVFRASIHKCIVYYPANDTKALEQLIVDESFEPFQDLIRNLMMCDKVGVKEAFSSLEITQKNYIKRNQQAMHQRVSNNSMLASYIIFIPYAIMLGMEFVYPIIVESMGQFNTAISQAGSM